MELLEALEMSLMNGLMAMERGESSAAAAGFSLFQGDASPL